MLKWAIETAAVSSAVHVVWFAWFKPVHVLKLAIAEKIAPTDAASDAALQRVNSAA